MDSRGYHKFAHSFNAEFCSYVCGCDTVGIAQDLHFHKNYELLVVQRGFCTCTVNNTEYRLSQGEAIFILPFQSHRFSVAEDSEVRCTAFHEHIILTLSQTLNGRRPSPPVFRPSEEIFRFFTSQMQLLFGEDSGMLERITPPAKRIRVKGALYVIESEFLDQTELIQTQGETAVTMAVVAYVSKNYNREISLADVAHEIGYNYQYLSRTFNKILGCNFKSLLNQYRMEHAFTLLQDTELPFSRIAYESGFQSIRSFNNTCKKIFGRTPGELRSENRSL
jgi:AraC-like DNA-binding protein